MFETFKLAIKNVLAESIKPRIEDPLEIGRKVTVRRGNGQLEDGYEIVGFLEGGKIVCVRKKIADERVKGDNIPLKELEQLNPPQK